MRQQELHRHFIGSKYDISILTVKKKKTHTANLLCPAPRVGALSDEVRLMSVRRVQASWEGNRIGLA